MQRCNLRELVSAKQEGTGTYELRLLLPDIQRSDKYPAFRATDACLVCSRQLDRKAGEATDKEGLVELARLVQHPDGFASGPEARELGEGRAEIGKGGMSRPDDAPGGVMQGLCPAGGTRRRRHEPPNAEPCEHRQQRGTTSELSRIRNLIGRLAPTDSQRATP